MNGICIKNVRRGAAAGCVLAACALYVSCAGFPSALPVPMGETSVVAVMAVQSSGAQSDYEYRMSYPVFEAAPILNDRIQNMVQNTYTDFTAESAANREAIKKTDPEAARDRFPDELFINWTNKQINTKYISIYFDIYSYTGGANGMQQSVSVNYDCASGIMLTLKDVLNPKKENWLEMLSAQVRVQLEQQLNSGKDAIITQMINAGTTPDENNFSVFVFDEYSAVIYFQKYQVAPGYFGMPSVTVSRTGW